MTPATANHGSERSSNSGCQNVAENTDPGDTRLGHRGTDQSQRFDCDRIGVEVIRAVKINGIDVATWHERLEIDNLRALDIEHLHPARLCGRRRTTAAIPAGARRGSSNLSDQVLALATGKTQQEITAACERARPNHVGAAIARHKRTRRIEERDEKLYAIRGVFEASMTPHKKAETGVSFFITKAQKAELHLGSGSLALRHVVLRFRGGLWFGPRRSHSSVPTRALTRLPRAVAVKDGRFLRPPEGLVLDGLRLPAIRCVEGARPPTARIRGSSASDVIPAYDWRTFLSPDAVRPVRG